MIAQAGKRSQFDKDKRNSIFEKYGGRCAYCGEVLDHNDFTIDHIYPLTKGGSNKGKNLVACCFACNRAKSDSELEQFRDLLMALSAKKEEDRLGWEKVICEKFGISHKIKRPSFYFEKIDKSLIVNESDRWAKKLEKLRGKYCGI